MTNDTRLKRVREIRITLPRKTGGLDRLALKRKVDEIGDLDRK